MKHCPDCLQNKDLSEFYRNGNGHRRQCKPCYNKRTGKFVSDWRRNAKRKLIDLHGGKCLDCGIAYPPYVMDFDHRDPSQKSFVVSDVVIHSFEAMVEESMKCDLVCANCHRFRTHRQRCSGCTDCNSAVIAV